MADDALAQRWVARINGGGPSQASIGIDDRGLVLGAGTVLAPMRKDRFGTPTLDIDRDAARIVALLASAFGHVPSPSVLDRIEAAAAHWQAGDAALANIALAFAGVPRLASDLQAYCLFLGDIALREMTPQDLMAELGFDPASLGRRYNPDQPRVGAGQGRTSGRWTSGGDGASAVPAAASPVRERPTEGRSAATSDDATSDMIGGRSSAGDRSVPDQPNRIDGKQLRFSTLRIAANGTLVPDGTDVIPFSEGDPLDPQGLNTIPDAEEQQAIADTLNTIAAGDNEAIKKLDPHPYRNLPHLATGAVLPPSLGGYTSYTVPSGQSGKGLARVLVDKWTGDVYYTNTHYFSFYHVTISPKH